ncbi:hypothetical protein [Amycolatopsis sp. NPDC052450]|uniref:hypothetical protein n=1 Tax=Amycolatopsis sp. NPDC052450 TaxID=3363937 RepID=UPI0037C768D9
MTYKELGLAIGLKDIELRNEMPRVLEKLANDCHNAREPPMTALVVNSQSGPPAQAGTATASHGTQMSNECSDIGLTDPDQPVLFCWPVEPGEPVLHQRQESALQV